MTDKKINTENPGNELLSVHWHTVPPEQVVEQLGSNVDQGLTSDEAKKRLTHYGFNRLTEKPPTSFFRMVINQLNNFIIYLLIAAAVISALLGDEVEAIAILLIVVLNAVLGVIQESRAEKALAALKKMAAPEAQVVRDGHRISIPSYELVPGDIVYLEAGNFIPADLRLFESVNLRVEEAALTGESLPVQKKTETSTEQNIPLGDRKNITFMGTTVNYGRGRGVVIGTGMHTQLGLIADMLQSVGEESTPLQQRLESLGRLLGYGALLVCLLVFVIGLVRAPLIDFSVVTGLFMVAVSLAVAAVPEGLPAVVTISLALGMREMVKRHALIRKLASVETLGSATVICSDKTGTLTQNEMTVTHLWVGGEAYEISGNGYEVDGKFTRDGMEVDPAEHPALLNALWVGTLNNDAELDLEMENDQVANCRIVGDPTEASLLVAAAKADIAAREINDIFPRVNEVPFDSVRKRMITIHSVDRATPEDISPVYKKQGNAGYAIVVKGAPDMVLNLCSAYRTNDNQNMPLGHQERKTVLDANEKMTQQALRVLGLAYKLVESLPENLDPAELEKDLIFAGMAGMIDPPRKEVKPALMKAINAGIRTIMITGDFPNTARAIAQGVGLLRPGHGVLSGSDLDHLDDAGLKKAVENTDVFARVSPEHKMRIVDALRSNGEIVAMTGDGVNDAPAIKRADIGVAMGITGTDVAKETADMVLTDDNYASIVSAIEQGRIIYANIRKFVYFLLSSNVAEIVIIFAATLAGLPTPLTAIQLLLLNLLTDGAPALALAMEKGDPDIMDQKPRPSKESILNGPMIGGIVLQTFTQAGATLMAYCLGLIWHLGDVIPQGANPILFLLQYNWNGVDVQTAETMAFVTLSLCELFRAYTVRSERLSVFQIGFFSNKWMQMAVAASIAILLAICVIPGLQPVFNTHWMSTNEWAMVVGFALIPAISEEIYKFFVRRQNKSGAGAVSAAV